MRVQDVGLAGEDDPVILEWAAQQERIFVTHDAKTMPGHAYARVRAGLRMCGVCVVTQSAPIGRRIEDLLLTVRCLRQDEWENRVRHVPL